MDAMDERLGEEVARIADDDGHHLHTKESQYSLKPENCNKLETQEVATEGEPTSPESSFHVLADFLDYKNVNRNMNNVDTAENRASFRATSGAGVTVEELTVRNYDRSNLPVIGTSSNREKMQIRQNQRHHLYRAEGETGSTSGASRADLNINQATPSVRQDGGYPPFRGGLRQLSSDRNEAAEKSISGESKGVSNGMLSHGGIKTKIMSRSGFSNFFVKTTLRGKGVICRGPRQDGFIANSHDPNNIGGPMVASNTLAKSAGEPVVASTAPLSLTATTGKPSSSGIGATRPSVSEHEGLSLREWLKADCHKVNKAERFNIFRHIVDLVHISHSQGVPLHDLRPSSFNLLQAKEVKYIGQAGRVESLECNRDKDIFSENVMIKRTAERGMYPSGGFPAKKQKQNNVVNSRQWPVLLEPGTIPGTAGNHSTIENWANCKSSSSHLFNTTPKLAASMSERLEAKWYASPEELNTGVCSIPSNTYSLGVLLFELLAGFNSERAHDAAMLDLRHRILPPNFLSENPKEAGFCLWLLHPEPASRPTTREILQSEVINGSREVFTENLSSLIDQDDEESELLQHFLISLGEQKQKHASKLVEEIRCLETDLEKVQRRNSARESLVKAHLHNDSMNMPFTSEALSHLSPISSANEMRLMSNISQLESAYFSMRSIAHLPVSDAMVRPDRDLLTNCVNSSTAQEGEEIQDPTDRVGAFFDGLCKYARYSKFEVRSVLRSGEFNNSANVICSLRFDRDEDYFATAGVSKKIKIYDFNAIFNDSVDIHYPAIEIPNRSRLSCICWNNYIKNYLASSDYDGIVKLWDVSTGQAVSQYKEHQRRAWSVDFSPVYPTKFASGSDDCSVKLWNINEKNCLGTIRNIANVCCVQFSSHSTHMLAFGSADYNTYCYDLRNVRSPWCVLAGHDKAVSYVKFLDHETLVTASTDNTLKVWDLNKTSQSGMSTNACSLTLSGHTNEKNFVGLSSSGGYIACGSETNEVYAYHRSLPMPITSQKFGSMDPISGRETDDDNGLFVSSVCWREKSDMVVAANSSGCIKVLQMV